MSRIEFRNADTNITVACIDVHDKGNVCIWSYENSPRMPKRITRLDKEQAIRLRDFLNKFIEANNE